MRPFILLLFILLLTGCSYSNTENKSILSQNNDSEIVESSNNKYSVFIRDVGDHRNSSDFGEGIDNYNQLILKNNKSGNEEVLVKSDLLSNLSISNLKNYPLDKLIGLGSPYFSIDEKRIYFTASAWSTSRAIFFYDIEAKSTHYLTDGEVKEVIKDGDNKGDLIVTQRKYFNEGGVGYCNFIVNSDNGERLKDLNTCL